MTDTDILYTYGQDETLGLHFGFDILVKPGNAEEVSSIVKICNELRIPITPRGGGSGVTGGALPIKGGVVVSLERLNRIIHIDELSSYVIAESGVVTAALCERVEQQGLYFPVQPSSKAYSFIGGNVAENAGSIHSCRYGTTAQYVLNLEVVLPTGAIIWTGANVPKNATGLNLTQLFVGSEGVLGIITKVVYRLIRRPAHEVTLLAGFTTIEDACKAVLAIRQSGFTPAAVEMVGPEALRITAAYLSGPLPLVKQGIEAHLLVGLQEDTENALLHAMETVGGVLEKYAAEPILVGTTTLEKERLWKLRFSIGAALSSGGRTYRDIDISIPLSLLYPYLAKVEEITARYQLAVAYFGHALDGNLHTMVMLDQDLDTEAGANAAQAVNSIYAYAIANGGAISGEHGIGMLQKEFMKNQFSADHLALAKSIKHVLDPNDILNPGKIF
ncbi:FAD-binding oxidoreductase [Hymenobacter rubripertinctus]|uniref:FAD-binding oxidoreductase n=1 Tax=Hymenobacter rubripertinctus TaxID=2029981 RepID=UPI0015FF089F|nr:FAD-linked oxidase C-terminal domain-containing protein [Hymenobacter rubripertinctus]